jgi:hypothetical protein
MKNALLQMIPELQWAGINTIRMNVRDFDEAYAFLTAHGFKNVQGDKVTDTGSSKVTLMVSPSGFGISLAEHIRK